VRSRVCCGILAVALLFQISAVSVSAVSVSDYVTDFSFVDSWDSYFDSCLGFLGEYFPDILQSAIKADLRSTLDTVVSRVGYGKSSDRIALEKQLATLNALLQPGVVVSPSPGIIPYSGTRSLRLALGGINGDFEFAIADHDVYGFVIMEVNSGLVLCNSKGFFPYASVEVVEDPDTGESVVDLGGSWRRYDLVDWEYVNLVSEYSLYGIGYALRDVDQDNDVVAFSDMSGPKYQYIQSDWYHADTGYHYVYCDSKGNPYVYRPNPDEWAQENDNNYYTDDDGDKIYDDGPTENNQLIDLDSNTIWFPGGELMYIDNLYYDEGNQTYYVDAHQEYDIDNNTYITNNYSYTYHINYTSVTYIGQTEEYNETYEFYYQLPDGRNSADLTAEELQALNVAVDVVPYIRSADNTSIRALYHFDANTRDSSYWSYAGGLTWQQGASLTYMDAGAFNGALYLDETAHAFDIKLPSAIGIADFTIQWRMYHSYTAAPVTDTTVSVGDRQLAEFNGSSWTLTDGGSVASGPGSWYEIALIRHDNTLYLYHNGVMAASVSCTDNLADTLSFVFGSEQQTYKYFDELRVLNYALVEDGAGYEPTAVPHDTNLTLVLPDSTVPVADEYWSFNSEGNLFKYWDFTQYGEYATYFTDETGALYIDEFTSNMWNYTDRWVRTCSTPSKLNYLIEAGFVEGAWRLSSSDSSYPSTSVPSGSTVSCYNGWLFPLIDYFREDKEWTSRLGLAPGGTYTFSVMVSDGTLTSLTFTVPSSYSSETINYVDMPCGGRLMFTFAYNSGYSSGWFTIAPPPGGSMDVVYMELVAGSTPNDGHELVSAIAPVADDMNTPTLAVRTDLDITGYQLGGVRPSLPSKGLVWGLVESGRITSLQIYNGQAWELVDGRVWTGSRWVPYYAYDVLLLKDLYDIVESDPTLDPIYTETGFWSWLQSAWAEMLDKLDAIADAVGGSSGSGSGSGSGEDADGLWSRLMDILATGISALLDGLISLITTALQTILSLVGDILSFFLGLLSDTVIGGIKALFSVFTDGSLTDGFTGTDDSGNTVTQLPEGVGSVFAAMSGMIGGLPPELLSAVVYGIGLLILLGVILLL